jgi:ABC-type uncharacterized transport system permease subunit
MTIPDSIDLLTGIPLVVIVPALVEIAKRQGLPVRFAGLAAIALAIGMLALAGLALGERPGLDDLARWLVGGIVYGLAAAGLYSQRDALAEPETGVPEAS